MMEHADPEAEALLAGQQPTGRSHGESISEDDMKKAVAADAIIRNNVILGNVSFRSHQSGSPSNLEFVHNTVINGGTGVEVRNVSGSVLIANNAVTDRTAGRRRRVRQMIIMLQ